MASDENHSKSCLRIFLGTFIKTFDYSGKAKRLEFFLFFPFFLIYQILLFSGSHPSDGMVVAGLFFDIILVFSLFSLTIRRLRDSGHYLWLAIFPPLTLLCQLAFNISPMYFLAFNVYLLYLCSRPSV